jgi:peptidoglycan/xylan/chitin deacetylase (PgdA/CDA1 family)
MLKGFAATIGQTISGFPGVNACFYGMLPMRHLPRASTLQKNRPGMTAAAMKTQARNAVAILADRSGLLARGEAGIRDRVTILCYHRILPDAERNAYHDPNLAVTPDAFRDHCRLLATHYTVTPLASAIELSRERARTDRPRAVITFDDGYRDNVILAAPILREFGLRATFFVVAGLVDTETVPWYDLAGASWNALARQGRALPGMNAREAVARAKQMSPVERQDWLEDLQKETGRPALPDRDLIMTSEQLRDLVAEGHEIGSHTMTHPILPQCDDSMLKYELKQSRINLSEMTGQDVKGICYPNGDCDARVLHGSVDAGYSYATSVEQGTNDLASVDMMALRRWFISQDRLSDSRGRPSDALFRMEICGLAHRIFNRGTPQ